MKGLVLILGIFISNTVLSAACQLETEDSAINQYTMENPFTACNRELHIPGLPDIWDEAWGRIGSYGDLAGSFGRAVCNSVFNRVSSSMEDVYSDIIGALPPAADPIREEDLERYCERYPSICGGGSGDGGQPPPPGGDLPPSDPCIERPWTCDTPRSSFFGNKSKKGGDQ